MVGRVVNAGYRRHLNFLSRGDYMRPRADYSQITGLAIVDSTTGPYHATVTRLNKFGDEEAAKYEYRRDGSGRR
jgi:hypothetical protein